MKDILRTLTVVACVTGIVMLGQSRAFGAQSLPFADGFEDDSAGALSTDGTWSEADSVTVQISDVTEGQKAASLTDKLTMDIDESGGDYTNVWVQVYAKCVALTGSSDPTGVTARAAFGLTTGGLVRAYVHDGGQGNIWTNLSNSPVTTGQWASLAVHLDYGASKWDLYGAASGYGAIMSRLNGSTPLQFSGTYASSELTELTVQSFDGVTSYVDGLAAAEGSPAIACGSSSNNLITALRRQGTTRETTPPPYTYAGANAQMSGDVGDDLKQGLANTDYVKAITGGVWHVWQLTGGAWNNDSGNDSLTITPETGLFITRAAGNDAYAFYPYDTLPTPTGGGVPLYGTSDGSKGWNLLSWPKDAEAANVDAWDFSGVASSGDEIWVLEADGITWTRYWFDGTDWHQGQSTTSDQLKKYQSFWHWRKAAGDDSWTVD